MFKYTSIFIQRYCPRQCPYCIAKDVRGKRKLRVHEWQKFFEWADKQGFEFHLILGNESLAYPWIVDFVKMMRGRYYTLYTTFPEPYHPKVTEEVIKAGVYSLSCGVDYIVTEDFTDDYIKSGHGVEVMCQIKNRIPDHQLTVTIHRKNFRVLPQIMGVLTRMGFITGASFVEYSHDGKHDFFPTKDKLLDYIFTEEDKEEFDFVMNLVADGIEEGKYFVQPPPEYFRDAVKYAIDISWHCSKPLILSIEEDGSLRLCAYRKGEELPNYTIFDLVEDRITLEEVKKLWKKESKKCPGCYWSYPYICEYWEKHDSEFGKKVIQVHASKYFKR